MNQNNIPRSNDLRVNLGAGAAPLADYVNIDRSYPDDVTAENGLVLWPGEVYPLVFQDETVDEVRASHILEHFSHGQTMDVLEEWIRVLRPGGTIKIAIPNFEWIARAYIAMRDDPEADTVNVLGYVMGGHVDASDEHGAIFDEDGLRSALKQLGIENIEYWDSEQGDCASLPVSLNLCGVKKGGPADYSSINSSVGEPAEAHTTDKFGDVQIPTGAVSAVATVPRLGFTDTQFCIIRAVCAHPISFEQSGGVFWDQGMTRVFESHLDDGTKYLLAIDYDSLFTADDVRTLYGIMEARPDIDALCPVQIRRENDHALFTAYDDDGGSATRIDRSRFDNDVLRIRTGHFGLTMIRVEALRRLPRPWFHARPDAEGRWGETRVDSDVAFWLQWADAGNTLYLANRVPIGHLQLMATWPSPDLSLQTQYVSEYLATGKPAGMWR